jgi:hypothetical protein
LYKIWAAAYPAIAAYQPKYKGCSSGKAGYQSRGSSSRDLCPGKIDIFSEGLDDIAFLIELENDKSFIPRKGLHIV